MVVSWQSIEGLEEQAAGRRDMAGPIRGKKRCCAVLDDDGGSREMVAGEQRMAVVDCAVTPCAIAVNLFAAERDRRLGGRSKKRRNQRLGSRDEAHAKVDHFNRAMRIGVSIARLVVLMKALDEVRAGLDCQFKTLSGVTEIDRAERYALKLLCAHFGYASRFNLGEMRIERGVAGREHDGSGIIANEIGHKDAVGGQCAGHGRDEDARDLQPRSQSASVERTCANRRRQA